MSLIIYKSERLFEVDSVRSLPHHVMPAPWKSGDGPTSIDSVLLPPNSSEVRWALAVDPTALWFSCEVSIPAECDTSLPAGAFVEGLWRQDVAEFFLRDAVSGEYQEFNVSPTGAWWTCAFRSYRQPHIKTRKPSTITSIGGRTPSGWSVTFGVRLDELTYRLSETMQLHVASMSHNQDGSPRYYSSHPIRGIEPDFHSPNVFMSYDFSLVERESTASDVPDDTDGDASSNGSCISE